MGVFSSRFAVLCSRFHTSDNGEQRTENGTLDVV